MVAALGPGGWDDESVWGELESPGLPPWGCGGSEKMDFLWEGRVSVSYRLLPHPPTPLPNTSRYSPGEGRGPKETPPKGLRDGE